MMTDEELKRIKRRTELAINGSFAAEEGAALVAEIERLRQTVGSLQSEIEEAAVYIQAGIDNDPNFPKDPRWKGVRTWIETRGESLINKGQSK